MLFLRCHDGHEYGRKFTNFYFLILKTDVSIAVTNLKVQLLLLCIICICETCKNPKPNPDVFGLPYRLAVY